MAESIEEALERRLYSTNKSSRIHLHGNNLFLVTTAIDLRYKLNFFFENLKYKVKIPEVKNHNCRETCQSVEVSLLPPKKPKAQLPKVDVPTNFLSFYLNRKRVQTLKKVINMI